MTNKNDSEIMRLKSQIAQRKLALGSPIAFRPVTNCSIDLAGQRINLHVANEEQLLWLYATLGSMKVAADKLLEYGDVKVSGYLISEWMKDVHTRLLIVSRSVKERELSELEKTLEKLLSEGKRTELEISQIKEKFHLQ